MYLSKNKALVINDDSYIYIKDGKEHVIDYTSRSQFIYLLTDYLILDEEQYFDLATKEWKSLNDAKLPDPKKSSFIDNNSVLYVNESNEVHVSYFNDGNIEDEKIGEIDFDIPSLYYWINNEQIFAANLPLKGETNYNFYLIHRELIEE
ncbi:MAG: hypothetical protein ACLRVU_07930 [Beduini sp.]|uniref:hypothetical protein n=1 Tax=Beduini sp. TaxID=1922300 RepID=UPI00399F7CA8